MKKLLGMSFIALAMAQGSMHAQVPVIINQPLSRSVRAGDTVVFTVGVQGAGPFGYQWQCNGTNLPNGIITTVAGNGRPGYSGDGGPATSATLDHPAGLAVDIQGNLFIADVGSNCVRKVNGRGLISTWFTLPATPGRWEYRRLGNQTVAVVGEGGGSVVSLAMDAFGCLFVADKGDERIWKVDRRGSATRVMGHFVAGDPEALDKTVWLNGRHLVALDPQGNLYIDDEEGGRIQKLGTNGVITTLISRHGRDDRLPEGKSIIDFSGLAVDKGGDVFLSDLFNRSILKRDADGSISTYAEGRFTGSSVMLPRCMAVDADGNLFVADDNRVLKVDTDGITTRVAGSSRFSAGFAGDGGPAVGAELANDDGGVAVDAFGNLFIADTGNHRVRKVGNTQGPGLVLHNVRAQDAGSYRVVVTGAGGSVTSSMATLTVSP